MSFWSLLASTLAIVCLIWLFVEGVIEKRPIQTLVFGIVLGLDAALFVGRLLTTAGVKVTT